MPIVPALITLPGACSCVGWLRPSLVATALTTWKSTRSCLFFISVQRLSEHFDSMWPSVSGLALHARQVGSESSPMIRARDAEVCITPSCAAIRKLSVVGLRRPSPSHMWVASLSVSSSSTCLAYTPCIILDLGLPCNIFIWASLSSHATSCGVVRYSVGVHQQRVKVILQAPL